MSETTTMFEATERAQLLELARCSIARGIGRHAPVSVPGRAWPPRLLEPRATFTTLTLGGQLRGCCGSIEPRRPLIDDVWHNAWTSAYADPRFEPLTAWELHALEITVSVLSPLEPIAAGSDAELIASLRPGVDGLLICCGNACATFLPAVWRELPEPSDFLAQLKLKAGLSSARFSPRMRAFRYRTESFHSNDGRRLAA